MSASEQGPQGATIHHSLAQDAYSSVYLNSLSSAVAIALDVIALLVIAALLLSPLAILIWIALCLCLT